MLISLFRKNEYPIYKDDTLPESKIFVDIWPLFDHLCKPLLRFYIASQA